MAETQKLDDKSSFIIELQSLRGLAALLVMIHHCGFYYTYNAVAKRTFEIGLNAHAAVVLFYVLSGFVLYMALAKTPLTHKKFQIFYLRRLFRIYPALWLTSALGLLSVLLLSGRPFAPTTSDWVLLQYRAVHPHWLKVASAFLGASHALPLPVWSITVELVASALMPLIVLTSRHWAAFLLLSVALLTLSLSGGMNMPMWVGGYLVDFMFGAELARWGVPSLRCSGWQRHAIWLSILSTLGLSFIRQAGGWNYANFYHNPYAAMLEAIFATGLIGTVAAWPDAFSLLRRRALVRLGDISYSLYLIHLPLLVLVAGVGGELLHLPGLSSTSGGIATITLIVLTVPLSIWLASLAYRFVELPGIALGRRIINR